MTVEVILQTHKLTLPESADWDINPTNGWLRVSWLNPLEIRETRFYPPHHVIRVTVTEPAEEQS